MARRRRGGARRAAGAALGVVALAGALGAGAGSGAGAGGGFPTPAGFEELAPMESCQGDGCRTLAMSGRELIRLWQRRREGGKRWDQSGHPLYRTLVCLAAYHEPPGGRETAPDLPSIAAHILGHLAELEDKVEAEAALRTGEGGGAPSRAEKLTRLFEAYLAEPNLELSGKELKVNREQVPADFSPLALKALHVNFYHQITGLLRWPHFDWRPIPKVDKVRLREQQERECRTESIPVTVLSLLNRADRRVAVRKQMAENVPFTFFDAVDGGALDASKLGVYEGMKLAADDPMLSLVPGLLMQTVAWPNMYLQRYWSQGVVAGEVGLLLTVKRAFEHALAEGLETLLMLEDDHVLPRATEFFPNAYCMFLSEVEGLQASRVEWDFVQLESYHWFGDDVAGSPAGLSPYFTQMSSAHNTHALLWHARGMRKVLASGLFMRKGCHVPWDEFLAYMANPGRYTRKDFHACFGEGGAPPERLAGFRWRGPRLVEAVSHTSSARETSISGGDVPDAAATGSEL